MEFSTPLCATCAEKYGVCTQCNEIFEKEFLSTIIISVDPETESRNILIICPFCYQAGLPDQSESVILRCIRSVFNGHDSLETIDGMSKSMDEDVENFFVTNEDLTQMIKRLSELPPHKWGGFEDGY